MDLDILVVVGPLCNGWCVMVNKDKQVKTGEVIQGDFPLKRSPIDYQLTIHINNLLLTYDKRHIIAAFKEHLNNPEKYANSFQYGGSIRNLVNHYGVETLRNWFTEIYGWEFKKVG